MKSKNDVILKYGLIIVIIAIENIESHMDEEVFSINIVNDFYLGFAGIYNVIIMIYYVRIIRSIKNSFNEDLIEI